MAQSACAEHEDPDLFFSAGRVSGGKDRAANSRVRAAQRICLHECPVREQCLADALETDERWGIRGGLTPRQRRALLRRVGT
jgi:WhiB family redox-sensing transcriptional regulator